MQILAHRGFWNEEVAKNSLLAINRALDNDFGFESDIRDYLGEIVISHDIANINCPKARDVFKSLYDYGDRYTFAINIKADGLAKLLKSLISEYGISNYFTFDMSVPQMIEYRDENLRFFTRQSEVEPNPCMYNDAAGVWIDGFWSTIWITKELLENHMKNGKEICIVSPDLHGKFNYIDFWTKLKDYNLNYEKVMLCTDHPDVAREYFNE